MGTNFYLEEDDLRIGKSSGGWCFALRVYPKMGINTLEDWKRAWSGKNIVNEYGEYFTEKEMLKIITERQWNGSAVRSDAFMRQNHAVMGPNNLIRSEIDGIRCVGHGEGTWDYYAGEFS